MASAGGARRDEAQRERGRREQVDGDGVASRGGSVRAALRPLPRVRSFAPHRRRGVERPLQKFRVGVQWRACPTATPGSPSTLHWLVARAHRRQRHARAQRRLCARRLGAARDRHAQVDRHHGARPGAAAGVLAHRPPPAAPAHGLCALGTRRRPHGPRPALSADDRASRLRLDARLGLERRRDPTRCVCSAWCRGRASAG